MVVLYLLFVVVNFMDDGEWNGLNGLMIWRYVIIFKYFDLNLLFFGVGDFLLELC